jgi:uncharacterized flavoprotein (TIGR03862 family)
MTERLQKKGVSLIFNHAWTGFSGERLKFFNGKTKIIVDADIVIFALGGASWPVTGSAGEWLKYFTGKGISTIPFSPSNCSFAVAWPPALSKAIGGKALKNIVTRCGTMEHAGEIVLTDFGLEGSGIYPLSPQIRESLSLTGKAVIHIDLKPQVSKEEIRERLSRASRKSNYTQELKKELNLSAVHLLLLKHFLSRETFTDIDHLSVSIKNFKITIEGTGPLEDAISTVGGISREEVDGHFQLRKLPAHYAIGEMLDYDAPTGGYLLQSCFSMAKYLADHLNMVMSEQKY